MDSAQALIYALNSGFRALGLGFCALNIGFCTLNIGFHAWTYAQTLIYALNSGFRALNFSFRGFPFTKKIAQRFQSIVGRFVVHLS
jgi:hypothetical protein